jgi:hypothetical protein
MGEFLDFSTISYDHSDLPSNVFDLALTGGSENVKDLRARGQQSLVINKHDDSTRSRLTFIQNIALFKFILLRNTSKNQKTTRRGAADEATLQTNPRTLPRDPLDAVCIHQVHHALKVACSSCRELIDNGLDVANVLRKIGMRWGTKRSNGTWEYLVAELKLSCLCVFHHVLDAFGPRNREHVVALSEDPSQGKLSWSAAETTGNLFDFLDKDEILVKVFAHELQRAEVEGTKEINNPNIEGNRLQSTLTLGLVFLKSSGPN